VAGGREVSEDVRSAQVAAQRDDLRVVERHGTAHRDCQRLVEAALGDGGLGEAVERRPGREPPVGLQVGVGSNREVVIVLGRVRRSPEP
jgi:hypothetical protein